MTINQPLPSINPTQTEAWKALERHKNDFVNAFPSATSDEYATRIENLMLSWGDFYVDFSKNRITNHTLSLLLSLAEEVQLEKAIDHYFSGAKINITEGRPVLHPALRDLENLAPEFKKTLDRMEAFSEMVIQGEYTGYTGKPITDIVNIGIGGSHLGPEMVVEALQYYRNAINVHFLANVDGDAIHDTLSHLNPETTLFFVVSKSFTTQETMTNAELVRDWFFGETDGNSLSRHFVAITANTREAEKFGISPSNMFEINDGIGGRFSLWSAAGLSICCAIGYSNFMKLLEGAHQMDLHFRQTPFRQNIPVLMALISIWYNNFLGAQTEGIVAYSQYLNKLVPYLQQACMESNGKGTDRNGNPIDYQTGTVVWGDVGTNAQHAFFQLLHQGTKWAPIDFIGFSQPLHGNVKNHQILMAHLFAQSESLWEGSASVKACDSHRRFEGKRPSNTILIKKLTPKTLGSLVALYEHKIFVQGVVWNICSFDQWGVELGKTVAKETLSAIAEGNFEKLENKSSRNLVKKFIEDTAQDR